MSGGSTPQGGSAGLERDVGGLVPVAGGKEALGTLAARVQAPGMRGPLLRRSWGSGSMGPRRPSRRRARLRYAKEPPGVAFPSGAFHSVGGRLGGTPMFPEILPSGESPSTVGGVRRSIEFPGGREVGEIPAGR